MKKFILCSDEKISDGLKKVILDLLSQDDRAKVYLDDPRCGVRLLPALHGGVVLIFSDGGAHPCHYGPAFGVVGAKYTVKGSQNCTFKYSYLSEREIKLEPLYTVSVLTYDGVTLDDSGFFTPSYEAAKKEAARLEKNDADCYKAYVELW